jgi:hypothetical protein
MVAQDSSGEVILRAVVVAPGSGCVNTFVNQSTRVRTRTVAVNVTVKCCTGTAVPLQLRSQDS